MPRLRLFALFLIMKNRLCARLALAAAFLAAAVPALSEPQLVIENGLLTMQVRNRPLREILQEIAAQAKVEITVRGAVEQPIFADFRRIPLEEGLRRITQNFNSLFVYTARRSSSSPPLNKVLLYAKEGEGGRNSAASPSAVFRPGTEAAPPLQPEPAIEKPVAR